MPLPSFTMRQLLEATFFQAHAAEKRMRRASTCSPLISAVSCGTLKNAIAAPL